MSRNKVFVVLSYVVMGAAIGLLVWQNNEFKSRLEGERNNSSERLEQVKRGMRERMEREVVEATMDEKTKSIFEAFNSHTVHKPDMTPYYIGEYQEVIPTYRPVEFECFEKDLSLNEEITSLQQELKLEGNLVTWCRDEERGLVVMGKESGEVVGYYVNLGVTKSVVSETKFIGVGHSLTTLEVELLDWRRSTNSDISDDWIKLQLVEQMESVSGGNPMLVDGGYNKYVYVISQEKPGVLVEMCSHSAPDFWQLNTKLSCSHVVKTSYPIIGR